MRRSSWFARGTLTSLFAISLAQIPVQASQPSVVAVDGTLCDLTRTLAGTAVSVTCLIPPGGDPHGYRLKPSDRAAIAKSNLIFHVGFGLTPSVTKLKSPGIVVAAGEIALPSYRGSDPHVWHDPSNSAGMIRVISSSLEPFLLGSDRAALKQRTASALAVFQSLQTWQAKQFSSLPPAQRVMVNAHRTYSHLADRFGLVEIAMLDSHTTGGVLRPSSLRKITQEVKSSGAKTALHFPLSTQQQRFTEMVILLVLLRYFAMLHVKRRLRKPCMMPFLKLKRCLNSCKLKTLTSLFTVLFAFKPSKID